MATYNSTAYTAKTPAKTPAGFAGKVIREYWTVTCSAAPSTSDTINFGYVPAGARIMSAILKCSDMDTNGSPTITLNVGDSGSASRIFSASTAAQVGTVDSTMNASGRFYLYTTQTLITGVAQANAATGASGTIELALEYIIEGQAS